MLVVLNPNHGSSVMGIVVELAIATRDDGVNNEGCNRRDIVSITKKEQFVQHT